MKKQLLLVMLCAGMFCGTKAKGQEAERLSGYVQAEALDRGQKDTVAQQCKEQPQRRNAGQKGEAGRLIVLRVQQSHSGLQKRSAGDCLLIDA